MTNRTLKALDLFCGGGGAALGMIQAGFEVTGIDVKPHPNYPGDFIQGDVFEDAPDLTDFDFVWASPPCQKWSIGKRYRRGLIDHPDLIKPTRALLAEHQFTCIENVPLAPLRRDLVLTGPMFGLRRILRRRHFEISWFTLQPTISNDRLTPQNGFITVTKSLSSTTHYYHRKAMGLSGYVKPSEACEAMGIDISMTRDEVGEAIPPAYAYYIASSAAGLILRSTVTLR